MRRPSRFVIPAVSCLLASSIVIGANSPAHADSTVLDDPVGDGSYGKRLDITRGALANKDRLIRVGVEFVKVATGDLIVFLQARGGSGPYRVVSQLDMGGDDSAQSDFLLAPGKAEPQTCAGLRVRWDDAKDVAVVRLPSRCLDEGDYGAVRFKVLTEIGSDADLMPDQTGANGNVFPWSDWVARG